MNTDDGLHRESFDLHQQQNMNNVKREIKNEVAHMC